MNQSNKSGLRRPKRYSSSFKITVFAVLAAALCICGGILLTKFISGKGQISQPQIDTAEKIPFQTLEPAENYGGKDNPDGESKPAVNGGQASNKYVRENEYKYNFLCLGCDRVGLNTDVIILASFDTKLGKISAMQIPRDTFIRFGGKDCRINSVYARLYNQARRGGSKEPETEAMEGLVNVFEENLTVNIDYWAICNLDGFVNMIDIIGGVEMDVPFDMYYSDPDQNLYINIKKGRQKLDGKQSEQFIRFRSNYIEGDVGRVNAQKIFLTALLNQMKTSLSVKNLPSIVGEAIKNVNTSLSVRDIIYFAKHALDVDLDSLTLVSMPGTAARAEIDHGAWFYIMHRADTLTLINRYFNVYSTDITDSIFDINRVFTSNTHKHINDIYITEPSDNPDELVHSGSEIDSSGMDIPLVRG